MSLTTQDTGGPVVRLTTTYKPEINLSKLTFREARAVTDLLNAASTMLNAPILFGSMDGRNDEVIHFLDELQALVQSYALDIAEAVEQMPATDDDDIRNRNWLLTGMRANCAEGLIYLTGPGAPDYYIDQPIGGAA